MSCLLLKQPAVWPIKSCFRWTEHHTCNHDKRAVTMVTTTQTNNCQIRARRSHSSLGLRPSTRDRIVKDRNMADQATHEYACRWPWAVLFKLQSGAMGCNINALSIIHIIQVLCGSFQCPALHSLLKPLQHLHHISDQPPTHTHTHFGGHCTDSHSFPGDHTLYLPNPNPLIL